MRRWKKSSPHKLGGSLCQEVDLITAASSAQTNKHKSGFRSKQKNGTWQKERTWNQQMPTTELTSNVSNKTTKQANRG